MSYDPVTAGIDLISSIVSRVWPDKTAQEQARLTAALQADNNLTELLNGQLKINEQEAQSSNLFVAGWRPCVGWVCAAAFAWQFVCLPILVFAGNSIGHPIAIPNFDITTMLTVLMTMLGMGSLRTYEKVKGVS